MDEGGEAEILLVSNMPIARSFDNIHVELRAPGFQSRLSARNKADTKMCDKSKQTALILNPTSCSATFNVSICIH